jgi:hypothetical protein
MINQQSWTDLKDRTEEIQELVMQVCDLQPAIQSGPEMLYRENNWGLTANAALYSALLEMRDTGVMQSHEEIMATRGSYSESPSGFPGTQEDQDETIAFRRRAQSVITKDISWFIQNGETEEIRLRAKEYREKALLDLYLEHVKQTGETYFPELQQLLEAEWKFRIHSIDDDG